MQWSYQVLFWKKCCFERKVLLKEICFIFEIVNFNFFFQHENLCYDPCRFSLYHYVLKSVPTWIQITQPVSVWSNTSDLVSWLFFKCEMLFHCFIVELRVVSVHRLTAGRHQPPQQRRIERNLHRRLRWRLNLLQPLLVIEVCPIFVHPFWTFAQ